MGVEIERKFLVDAEAVTLPERGREIRQGYLARGAGRSVRVRLSRELPGGQGSAWITVKGPDGLARAEYEYPIPLDDAAAMLDELCLPGQIEKTRYQIDVGGHTFEVDVYAGRHAGLVTAEVELDDAATPVTLPGWVTREVTGEAAWSNAALSRPPELAE